MCGTRRVEGVRQRDERAWLAGPVRMLNNLLTGQFLPCDGVVYVFTCVWLPLMSNFRSMQPAARPLRRLSARRAQSHNAPSVRLPLMSNFNVIFQIPNLQTL